jgi:hypothetical protein
MFEDTFQGLTSVAEMIAWHNDNRDLGLLHLTTRPKAAKGILIFTGVAFNRLLEGPNVKGEATRMCRDTAGHGQWRNLSTSPGAART